MFKRILAGVAATFAVATAASAADIAPIVVPPPPPVVVAAPVPVFDWSGPYVGTRAALMLCNGTCWLNLDVHAGYNLVAGRFLAGVELGIGRYLLDGEGLEFNAMARAGVVLGRVLVYGKAGIVGYGAAPFDYYLAFGGGAELAIGDRLSVFAGVTAERITTGGPFYPGIEAGLNFHFGR